MQITELQLAQWISSFIWPFCRVSAMFMVMPIIGSRLMPTRIRLLLAVIVTIALIPVLPELPAHAFFSIQSFIIVSQQILLGIIMGFMFQFIFQAFIIGGQVIAMQSGLGFASMVDPASGISVPIVSQFYLFLVTLMFLAVNGHLLLIELLAKSFTTLPIVLNSSGIPALWDVVLFSKIMFTGAITIVLPAIAALLVVNLSFAVMTRAAPQLNIFSIGFPMTLLLGLIILYVTLEQLSPHIYRLFNHGFAFVSGIVG